MINHIVSTIVQLRSRLRVNKYLNLVVKTAVALLLLGVLYYDLSENRNLGAVWQSFTDHLSGANLFLLLVVLSLMPLNWLAETEKWRQFILRYEYFPRWKALLAVMTGVSFSLFTPNRVGEYGGRILYVHPDHQWKAVVANLVGNFCQYMVLLGMGVLGGIYIISYFNVVEALTGYAMVTIAAIGFSVMLWVYYNLESVIDFIKHHGLLKPFLPYIGHLNLGVIRQFSRRERTEILAWAFLRYAIYATQYFLLLRFFGIHTGIISGFAGIAGLFLLQTSIPLPPLAGLMARGNMAVILWEQFGANEIAALAATFTLWVINLVIPALIGTFSFFHVNIAKSLGYDESTNDPQNHPQPVAVRPTAES